VAPVLALSFQSFDSVEFVAFPVVATGLIQRSAWRFDSLCLLFECMGQPWIAIVLS
jgi:hypothetical protein